MGTKEFSGKCTKEGCGNVFVRDDGLEHPIYMAPRYEKKEPKTDMVNLVSEAYRHLITIESKELESERYERLKEKASERLFRRLDKLTE